MRGNKIIKITLFISFALHVLCIGMPLKFLHFPTIKKPENMLVLIEIENPQEELNSSAPEVAPQSKMPAQQKEIVPQSKMPVSQEEIVAENYVPKVGVPARQKVAGPTHLYREAILRYQDIIKQRIEEVRRYPLWARRQGIEGSAQIKFTLLSNGEAREITLARSSGAKILDEEAIATIKRARPFPPIPEELHRDFIIMNLAIAFHLQ